MSTTLSHREINGVDIAAFALGDTVVLRAERRDPYESFELRMPRDKARQIARQLLAAAGEEEERDG